MLSDEQNRTLTQVGAGTPMGELLRRYWMPIAAVAELDDKATKPVRLLGEDLVLYKDQAGTYGLVDRHCPHRRADLSYGWVEDCGLRCNYHGWVWDHTGKCLEQPFEEIAHPEARFKDRVRIKAYPGGGQGRPAVGLPGTAAGAARAHLGAFHLAQRLRPDRLLRDPLQLVPVPGELDRPRALRVAAQQLDACLAG